MRPTRVRLPYSAGCGLSPNSLPRHYYSVYNAPKEFIAHRLVRGNEDTQSRARSSEFPQGVL